MNERAIREMLNKRHAEIQDRVRRTSRDARHAGGLNPDFEEQAVELENDDVLAGLNTALFEEIQQIEKTLARLDSGQYGVCEACGKTIGKPRLDALPYATRCLKCERK